MDEQDQLIKEKEGIKRYRRNWQTRLSELENAGNEIKERKDRIMEFKENLEKPEFRRKMRHELQELLLHIFVWTLKEDRKMYSQGFPFKSNYISKMLVAFKMPGGEIRSTGHIDKDGQAITTRRLKAKTLINENRLKEINEKS